jgi:hypothetical protein
MIGFGDEGVSMTRRAVLAAMILLVVSASVGAFGGPTTVAVSQQDGTTDNETAAAGERLSGALGVEDATVSGNVERARFQQALGRADSETARAEAIATYLNRSRGRLDSLETQGEALDRALEDGSMTVGEHGARTARLGARAAAIQRLTVELANASEALPAEHRREYDIEPAAIRRVGDRAESLAERTRSEKYRVDTAVFGDIARMAEAYNSDIDTDDSDPLRDRFRGERVDLHVESSGDSRTVSFRIADNGQFTEMRAGSRSDATLRADTDRTTVQRVASADDGDSAFHQAVRDDEIRLEGIGVANSLEWRLIELATSIRDRL